MSPLEIADLASPLLWVLIALQIAMGGFDIVVHHEITERLAWKPNAGQELRLHAMRNAFYAVLFGLFGWLQPTGWLAALLIAVLVAEIVITLWDFVEEDRTRKLPPTERVLHTLLAINYGAILALALPALVGWAGAPTGLVPVDYGLGSWIMTVAAIGCVGFALRDLATSRRARSFVPPAPVDLSGLLSGRRHVLVTGGTGFIGTRLVEALVAAGHDVTVLTRKVESAGHLAAPLRLVTSLDQIAPDQPIDAVVNLAGSPVADFPWTRTNRLRILRSRVKTTRHLVRWMERRPTRPEVLVSGSAIGWYGERGDDVLTEADGGGKRFGYKVCAAWEREAGTAARLGVRVVTLRIGLVLGRDGGPLGRLLPVFDIALGGPIGAGRQWMSWIGLDDMVRLIAHAIATPDLAGAVNATAPHPVRNGEFAATLGRILGRPAVLPLPAAILASVGGDMTRELLLASQRVLPAKVLTTGFTFTTPTLEAAVRSELGLVTPTGAMIRTAAVQHLPASPRPTR